MGHAGGEPLQEFHNSRKPVSNDQVVIENLHRKLVRWPA